MKDTIEKIRIAAHGQINLRADYFQILREAKQGDSEALKRLEGEDAETRLRQD